MKNLFTTACVVLLFGASFAQNTNNPSTNSGQAGQGQGLTRWKTNGNNIDDTARFIGTTNNKALRLKTNNTERIRISKEGNIGIGTSTPETKLDVNGNVTLRDKVFLPGLPTQNGLNHILFYDSITGETKRGSTKDLRDLLGKPRPDPCPIGDIQNPYWASDVNKLFVECPQVYVGVGTDKPKSQLDVQGTTYTKKLAVRIPEAEMTALLAHLKLNTLNPAYANSDVFIIENMERQLLN